jgi:hypothetical protein
MPNAKIDPAVRTYLEATYAQMMWLAKQPDVTCSMARAWYTHVVSGKVTRRIRQFSGKVSRTAARSPEETLRLEHHRRIQTTLTKLVEHHKKSRTRDPEEFIRVVLRCESVHIVTFEENYAAMRAKGDYSNAGIKLVSWESLPLKTRRLLWTKMLRGRVANAGAFAVPAERSG